METNTVIISVERYEELREIENKAKSIEPYKHTVLICNTLFTSQIVQTNDDATAHLAEHAKDLAKDIDNLRTVLDSVKKMSFREFRKWKKTL